MLDKPIVTDAIAGDGIVDPMKLACVWRDGAEIYRLSVGAWRSSYDSYGQTSRPGYNLVLRLNFSNQHDTEYRRLIDKKDRRPFVFEDHPVSRRRWHTLAWSRLDIDLRTGEALVEEVQNDWLRYATSALRRAKPGRSVVWYCGVRMDARNLATYVNGILDTPQENVGRGHADGIDRVSHRNAGCTDDLLPYPQVWRGAQAYRLGNAAEVDIRSTAEALLLSPD